MNNQENTTFEERKALAVFLYSALGQILVEGNAAPLLKQIEESGFVLALRDKDYIEVGVNSYEDLKAVMNGLSIDPNMNVAVEPDGAFCVEWVGDK